MIIQAVVQFEEAHLGQALGRMSGDELDQLDFGVIGFDASTVVRVYNAFESDAAGLRPNVVIGHPLFKTVAPCMNNFMVAQRFEDAAAASQPLDIIIPYVLTLRMRPAKVRLRLVCAPDADLRYVLVQRNG